MGEEKLEIISEFHKVPGRRLLMAVHHPKERTERSKIAVLQMHRGTYCLSFEPLVELARLGYTAVGSPFTGMTFYDRMLDVKAAVDYVRTLPGVEKLVLMGHSQGGCVLSGYQSIAESGIGRFRKTERLVPFPDYPTMNPADGLMLVDANYGIMSVMAMDPAIKDFKSGYKRDPELDIYNPENGYKADGTTRYNRDFVRKFQKAQAKYYEDLLAYAMQRDEDIRLGKTTFADDEPIVIPGAGGGSDNNKLFIQDNSLLGHTSGVRKLLHKGGVITEEVVHTCRVVKDAPSSTLYNRGSSTTTVKQLLEGEMKFTDYGYDESTIWGVDWEFIPYCSQGNVLSITVPLLCQGNQGSHEFINVEQTYEKAASKDKDLIFVAGSDHGFRPVKQAEKYPGEFGAPAETFAAYMADWLAKPGRFMD